MRAGVPLRIACLSSTPCNNKARLSSTRARYHDPLQASDGTQMLHFVTDKDGSQRSLSLFVLVGVLFLEVGRDGLHDLLGLGLVINGVSVKVPGSAELQLGDTSLFILLDCDLIGLGEVVLFPSHHLDEFFQIFDFLGLREKMKNWLDI